MTSGPHLRSQLLAARERLAEGREKLRVQHARGSPGLQVCARLTALFDSIVMQLFDEALGDLGLDGPSGVRQHVALVPHGGYGRRALAPYSDVDLMILHAPEVHCHMKGLARRLMQDIYDVGLDLGHSVRTPVEACHIARHDVTVFTSLVESRILAGSDALYQKFLTRFTRTARRRARSLVESFIQARREEQAQYGKTIYLLEPNIKRSRGSLRDIHLLRWIGFVRFGATDPDQLALLGALSKQDQRAVQRAYEFLSRLRNEMHFHAGKAQDVLDRGEQMRLADVYGMTGRDNVLPVEQFMREYFHHSGNVRNLVSRFEESALPTHAVARVLGPMFSHRVEGDFLVGPREISATRRGLEKLTRDVEEVLRLADLANLYNKRIAHRTWAAVHRAAPGYSHEITPAVANRFLSLLAQPPRLGELLRRLHELGVLEKIIPAFQHARHLLQFNEYHKYTVDEHCIQAVECATEFAVDRGPLGHMYRQIKQKRTLHLALLLHDLGKGLPGDHSDVGLEIAAQTAERLHLPERETEVVKFLVHKHLLMSHLAFRRDLSDERLIVRFAVEVGSPEVLRMLYVLTCADLSSVGPGVLNEWKVDVLTHLYRRTLRHLAGDALAEADRQLEMAREKVRRCFSPVQIDTWLGHQIDALPPGYLYEQPAEKIAAALGRLRSLELGGADVWGEYLPETKTVEFLVGVDQSLSEGLFYRLTGALTSKGLAILSAHINSLADGLVLDRFVVEDPDYAGEPPQERIQSVCQAIFESIHSAKPPKFRQVWGEDGSRLKRPLSTLPTEVRIDNSTSQEYTIVDVFTFNRRGLLYRIGRTLFELDLSIGVAKIGTYLDQVVDVFYVTDNKGRKIQDEERLNEIRQRLLEAIELEPDHGTVNRTT